MFTDHEIMSTPLSGWEVSSAPHDNAFILPRYRVVLFQDSSQAEGEQGYLFHHVPALGSDTTYQEQHTFSPWQELDDEKDCSTCNNVTLDNGSLSPCGSLFVTLASFGHLAGHVVLEHWQLDYGRKLCTPHMVHRVHLHPRCKGLPGIISNGPEDDFDDWRCVNLHVAWHPFFEGRLVYAVAVGEGDGMVHVVDGRNHAILKTINTYQPEMAAPVRIQWTPDGSRLAVHTAEHLHIMRYGAS